MKKIKLVFKKCIQESQVYGSDNEHMDARIFFEANGVAYICNVRQPHGENHSFDKDPIEVMTPKELRGKINYEQFRDEVEKYYKLAVGSSGNMINIQGSSNVQMTNNAFNQEYRTVIEEAGRPGAW